MRYQTGVCHCHIYNHTKFCDAVETIYFRSTYCCRYIFVLFLLNTVTYVEEDIVSIERAHSRFTKRLPAGLKNFNISAEVKPFKFS